MKIFTVLLTLVFSLAAVAGPEEHKQAQTCYSIVSAESSEINSNVPAEICLETFSVDTSSEKVFVYSYFDAKIFKNIKLDSLTRKNEDFFNFKSFNVFRDDIDELGNTQKLTIIISGLVDNVGEADVTALNLTVNQFIGKTYTESAVVKNTYKYRAN